MTKKENEKFDGNKISSYIKGDLYVFTSEDDDAPFINMGSEALTEEFDGLSEGEFIFSPRDFEWKEFSKVLVNCGYSVKHFPVSETTEAIKFFTREFKKYWGV